MTAPAAGPVFIGSGIYRGSSYGGLHPLRVARVSTVMDLARALGWLPAGRFRQSPVARAAALTAWHTPAYVAALERAEATQAVSDDERSRHGLGTLSNPVFPQMFRRPATGAGGVMLAAELLAARPGIVHVPGGGTHHGLPDRANGFCYLNDPVLALMTLRRAGMRRMAYIDIDAHHPDGVELAFGQDPDCLMISTHEENRWPFSGRIGDSGAGQVYNLPLPRGLNDTEMAHVRDRLILPVTAAFAPEVIVLQCGADAVEEDPLSRLSLSNNAHWDILRALMPLCDRLMVLGGGGYNPWTVGRMWAGLWGIIAGHEIPDRLPAEAAAVLRGLSWNGGDRPPPAPHLLATLCDPPRAGPVRPEVRDRVELLSRRSPGP